MDGDSTRPPRLPVSRVKLKVKPDNAPAEYRFNTAQHTFLSAYAETLDMQAALKASGLRAFQVNKNPYLQAELERLHECAMFAHRAKSTVGNHQRLMAKFEQAYDRTGDARIKQGYAGVLARMSDSAMKAAGEFSEDDGTGTFVGVQVVLNFGGRPEDVKPSGIIDVDAVGDG